MPNKNQGTGRIPSGKKGTSKPKGGYGWGDGKGRIHSISKGQHTKNVATRRENIRRNDPAAFTQPRSLNDVLGDANTSANLRYGGQERALGLQAQQVPVWFAQYRAQVQGINQGIQQGYQKAIGDVTAQAQQTAASDTTARNSLGAQMQQDAASRGATVDPKLLAGDVNAANVRNTNQAAFANLLGSQGQAQNTYMGGLQTAGSAAEVGQKTRISQEQTGVATDKGNYKSQYVADAKDTERKNLLENKAFGLDVAKVETQAATSTANSKRTAASQAAARRAAAKAKGLEVNKFGYTNKEWASFTPAKRQKIQKQLGPSGTGVDPKKPKGAPKLSASGLKTKSTIRTGVARVRAQDVNRPGYWEKSFETLVQVDGLDPVVARAIIQGARVGRLGPKTAQTLKDDYGITGITFPKPKKRKGASSGPGGGPHGTNRP